MGADKKITIKGAFSGRTLTYDGLWDEAFTAPRKDLDILWVPRYGWHNGLFYDGPIVYRGKALAGRGTPCTIEATGESLEAFKPLGSEQGCSYSEDFSYELALESLKWAARQALPQAEEGFSTFILEIADFNLQSALQLVILRKAFLDVTFCVLQKPPDPYWRRFLQNLDIKFQKGLSGVFAERILCLSDLVPRLKEKHYKALLKEIQRVSEVVPCGLT